MEDENMVKHVKCKRLAWIGHANRMKEGRLPKQMLNAQSCTKLEERDGCWA